MCGRHELFMLYENGGAFFDFYVVVVPIRYGTKERRKGVEH
jgi:hypothetical protein